MKVSRGKKALRLFEMKGGFSTVPDELLLEILYLLPARYAVICKLVCKRWLSLISDPAFIPCFIKRNTMMMKKKNPNHHPAEDLILKSWGNHLFVTPNPKDANFHLPFSFLPPEYSQESYEVNILASSGDMFLCSIMRNHELMHDQFICNYVIWNPFTKDYVQLPPAPTTNRISLNHYIRYGFIYRPLHCVGDDEVVTCYSSIEFIIVRLHYPPFVEMASEFELDILSSQTWQWTTATMQSPEPAYPFIHSSSSALSRNGLLYWLTTRGQILVHDPYTNKVSYFVDRPPPEDGMSLSTILVEFNLCCDSLFMYKFRCQYWDLDIFQLEDWDRRPKWRLDRVITLTQHVTNLGEMLHFSSPGQCPRFVDSPLRVVGFHPDDPDVLYLRGHFQGFGSLNLRTRTFKREPISAAFSNNFYRNTYSNKKYRRFSLDFVVAKAPIWPSSMPVLLHQFEESRQ